ncbi:MAG: hypothetical protein JNJ91_08720 [Flavobacteriales bacterium]|nr:hypothetical protein [Flavobacteriales bacterium]
MGTSLLIAGATGVVGAAAVQHALADARVGQLITWGRRPLPDAAGRIVHWGGADLIAALDPAARADAVICCLGTTIKAVKGDKQAFIHVDHDLVVALGAWASGKGVRFCVVSALGADAKSLFFYNQVKGRMEDALRQMDFAALHIFRPSILDGPRTEQRTGERIALVTMRAIAPLLPAPSRPMKTEVLGKALVNAAITGASGAHVHTTKAILELAR